MRNTVTVEDVKAHLEDLLGRARRDEEWVIVRADGQPVAKLAALPIDSDAAASATAHASLIGLMKGQIKLSPDFDEPLEDFKPYME